MDKYEALLRDIKLILEAVGEVNSVSHGKVVALDTEDTFTSVYISPEMDNFDLHVQGLSQAAYTNTFYIRLTVNMDCTGDDLQWVTTRHAIIDAMLNDEAIWSNILDRDIVSVAHDDYTNYPRKSMAMLFEFKIREECVV